jgi:hypothetical protein
LEVENVVVAANKAGSVEVEGEIEMLRMVKNSENLNPVISCPAILMQDFSS